MFRFLLALMAVAGAASPALAETRQCTSITSLPVTISSSGTYCLASDLSTPITAGNAIDIKASNVTLDCNDRALIGTGNIQDSGARGVFGKDLHNVTVRNCTIRGFYKGVELLGATGRGHLVEGNLIHGSGLSGVDAYGDGVTVRDNRVLDTGKVNWTRNVPRGILVHGASARVTGNQVAYVEPYTPDAAVLPSERTNDVFGIIVSGDQPTVESNFVQELLPYGYYDGRSYGIELSNNSEPLQALVRDNALLVAPYDNFGIHVGGQPIGARSLAAGKSFCSGNTMLGWDPAMYFDGPLGGCTVDGGGNYVH